MSSTADARRGAPSRPALAAGESTRTPRPWAAPLAKPATRILVAGGLTLAGWLLGGALAGSTASAAETATCQHATASSSSSASTVEQEHHGHHRKSHRESGAATCAQQPTTGDEATQAQQPDETPATETPATETPATETKTEQTHETSAVQKLTSALSTKDTQDTTTTTTKATSSGGDLLGGLVSSVLKVVGGTLTTVTHTVGAVTDTLSHTVLAPLTQPPADNPDAPVLLPLDDILGPVLNGGSNSGGVTVTLPDDVTAAVTQTTTSAVTETAPAAAAPAASPTTRVAVVHLIERQHTLPATPEQQQPRDSGVHARNGGGGSGPGGLPGGTSAPSAPATSAAPGHDGSGGARQQFAVHTDDATTTQLKLIGTSRDHEVDGAGREAALPTTSPD